MSVSPFSEGAATILLPHHIGHFPVNPLVMYFIFLLSFLAGNCQFILSMSFFRVTSTYVLLLNIAFFSCSLEGHSNLLPSFIPVSF